MYDLPLALINYAIANALATQKDVDIFKDYTPDDPPVCTVISEYAGLSGPWYSEMGLRSIQVMVRSPKSQEAMAKIWALYELFRPKAEITTLGTQPCVITMRNIPIKIGRDTSNRYQYAFNMGITTKIF